MTRIWVSGPCVWRRPFIVAFAACLSLVPFLGTPAAAQQSAASIIGQVKDESGGILPGVTVTAKSLEGSRRCDRRMCD